MIRYFLYFLAAIVGVLTIAADSEFGGEALLVAACLSAIAVSIFRRFTQEIEEKAFITDVFIGALVVRLAFGLMLHSFDLRMFAGPDAVVYDVAGGWIADYWMGRPVNADVDMSGIFSLSGSGWGMNYFLGVTYVLLGKSVLVAQTVCAVVGAATAPMAYFCAGKMYSNRRVSRLAALGVAFFPAFIIWSSQLLKDGLIVFLLVVTMTMVIQLQKQFSVWGLMTLIVAMIGVMSLRFYTFYVVMVAVAAGFVIGIQTSIKAVFQRIAIMSFVALALIYFGFIKIATGDLETYGNLDRINYSRSVMANSESGYGGDADVSTTTGALTAIPVGFAYLMFAPFPWEMKNFRQFLTLPDVLLWWILIPFSIYGLWYTVRHRLRPAIPILVFIFILTIAYSMFQGNLGAAYRQRTQIQVFLFLFIGVGLALIFEKRADKKMLEERRTKEMVRRQRARFEHSH